MVRCVACAHGCDQEEEMDQEEFESSICFRGVRNPCSVCGCKRSGGVRGETKNDVLDQHDNDQVGPAVYGRQFDV